MPHRGDLHRQLSQRQRPKLFRPRFVQKRVAVFGTGLPPLPGRARHSEAKPQLPRLQAGFALDFVAHAQDALDRFEFFLLRSLRSWILAMSSRTSRTASTSLALFNSVSSSATLRCNASFSGSIWLEGRPGSCSLTPE